MHAQRDWGHAKDYVHAMWLMMQQEKPEDYVVATGVTTTVREFVRLAFAVVGIGIEFTGTDENEKAVIKSCSNADYQLKAGEVVTEVDSRYFRPTEVELLIGDASKAKQQLGWQPTYTLEQLVKEMVEYDIVLVKKEKLLIANGFTVKGLLEH